MASPMPARAHGPGCPGLHASPDDPSWCDLRKAVIIEAEAVRHAVNEMAGRPGDPAALALAASILAILEIHADMARRWGFDESVLAAERERAYAQGAADARAARRGLHAVPGPR